MTSETTGGTTTEYEYDANGALTKSDDGTTENVYTYDYDGYLTAFDTTGTENDATYTYDADKRRIRKVVDSDTIKYFLAGSNVIADYDGGDVLQATYVTPGLDQNLSQTRSGSTYYYMADGLGSIRNLVDSSQDAVNVYDYYAFGRELGSWTENITNRYTYTAREWDDESEQYYYRARYYDGTGRFYRRDPIGYRGGLNLYQYVRSDPVVYVDPQGTWKRVAEGGHVWEAEQGDTLWGLAAKQEYGGQGRNWPCLWPTSRTENHGYPNTIWPCDKYDASNLATPAPGATELKLSVSADMVNFGGPVVNGDDVVSRIQSTSGEGGTPISLFILEGHSGGGQMGGTYVKNGETWDWKPAEPPFTVGLYTALPDPAPDFTRAQNRMGPKRCWFTRDARAWFAGCHTSSIAEPFAGAALRNGATAHGTKTYSSVDPSTGITWGDSIKWVNGLPEFDGTTNHNADWQYSGAWNAYNGGL